MKNFNSFLKILFSEDNHSVDFRQIAYWIISCPLAMSVCLRVEAMDFDDLYNL